MANWIKFNGSEEQFKLIDENKNILVKMRDGSVLNRSDMPLYLKAYRDRIDQFLVPEPHPHRDMIIEWANTGRPVWIKFPDSEQWEHCPYPGWSSECEYSFDPPREKKTIWYRVALLEDDDKERYTMTADCKRDIAHIEQRGGFIKWISDWKEV